MRAEYSFLQIFKIIQRTKRKKKEEFFSDYFNLGRHI